jgi:hypothetical protein
MKIHCQICGASGHIPDDCIKQDKPNATWQVFWVSDDVKGRRHEFAHHACLDVKSRTSVTKANIKNKSDKETETK